ncbi:hypothetical protein CEXT_181491 [Caerostris extrusa]|uniref:Uncharacterized protein n=1 Tax=Caerostris extrusa TaxID=172846 RepID=A0AAV4REE0_CAEEX|nr:hypothetical protein CEXT_181491 [Caerostris extrusa]
MLRQIRQCTRSSSADDSIATSCSTVASRVPPHLRSIHQPQIKEPSRSALRRSSGSRAGIRRLRGDFCQIDVFISPKIDSGQIRCDAPVCLEQTRNDLSFRSGGG